MRKNIKKSAAAFLILAVFISFFPVFSMTAYASVESGKTGDCTWTYDSAAGIVTISGNGRMEDYEDNNDYPPWHPSNNPCSDNSHIKKVVIEEGVTHIGDYSFVYEGITSIVIPDSVTEIGAGAFFCCSELTEVKLGKGLKKLDLGAFNQCGIESIDLPEGLEYIGACAFYENKNLNSVTIPNSVTFIGYEAFWGTAFTNVFIPESVIEIEEDAFGYCDDVDEYGHIIGDYKKIDGFNMTVVGDTAGEKYAIENGFPYTVAYVAPTNIKNAEISGIADKVYTGEQITQDVSVKYDGKDLIEGTDYQISYSNNTNAGTASVIITGIGAYGGTIESTFTIAKADNTLTAKAKPVTLKAKVLKKKSQTVKKAKAYTVSGGKGKVTYKLAGVTKSKFKKYFKVNTSNGNITVKKNLKKGTYKVKVTITASGTDNYKLKKKNVTVTVKVR